MTTYSTLGVEQARLLAKSLHLFHRYTGDKDYPYIYHLEGVVDQLDTNEEKIVGYLHDILEDTPMTFDTLTEIFGIDIAIKVALLTRNENESYEDYIELLIRDEVCRKVKKADLLFNYSRLDNLETSDPERFAKLKARYMLALKIIGDYENGKSTL